MPPNKRPALLTDQHCRVLFGDAQDAVGAYATVRVASCGCLHRGKREILCAVQFGDHTFSQVLEMFALAVSGV